MTKIACSSYSFQQLIDRGELTQLQTIEKAKAFGFTAIEIVGLIYDERISEGDYVQQLKAELDRLDFPITSFTFSADLLNGCEGDSKAEVARVKKMIDYAAILGAPRIRHDATWGKNGQTFAQVLPDLAVYCREIAAYGATKGIQTMVENHGFLAQDSTRMEDLYTAVNHPNFKLLVDMGNFLCVDESPIDAVSRLASLAGYAHVKDFHFKSGSQSNPGTGFFKTRGGNYLRGAIIGHGEVPITQCLAILKAQGYTGDFAIEFEGMEDNLSALRICLDNLQHYFA